MTGCLEIQARARSRTRASGVDAEQEAMARKHDRRRVFASEGWDSVSAVLGRNEDLEQRDQLRRLSASVDVLDAEQPRGRPRPQTCRIAGKPADLAAGRLRRRRAARA